jgi:antitoxin VapB
MSVLSVKSDEANSLARQIARERGEGLTAVVTGALRDRLAAVQRRKSRCDALDRIQQIARSRVVLDDRPHDEIVGYDEAGAPR